MQLFKSTNHFILFVATFAVLAFTIVSFFFSWAESEGTLGNGILVNAVAASFFILQYPTALVLDHINITSALFPLVLFGIMFNALFYGWLIERTIFIVKKLLK